jgi:hypothetical protein
MMCVVAGRAGDVTGGVPMSRFHHLYVVFALMLFGMLAVPGSGQEPAKVGGKTEARGKELFDGKSLDGWKSADFFKHGKVHVADGTIVMEKGDRMTGVTYTRKDFPKIDYEVTLEGKKLAGNDFFCTTTFPVGDSFCSLVVGGWGGRVVGLSSVGGVDASENETRREMGFETGKWYRIRIRVTAKRIEAWIDAKQVVDLDSEGRKISTRIECIPNRPFGICTWDTAGAVRDIRVRLLTDEEKKAIAARQSESRP